MRRFIIREQIVNGGRSEESFSPGPGLTILITFLLYALYYLLREIPANIIDIIYYSQQHVSNQQEAAEVINKYLALPGTMIIELLLTSMFAAVTLLYVRKIEKRPLNTLGFVRKRALKHFSFGYAAGIALFIAAAVLQILLRPVEFLELKTVSVLFFLAFIVQALSEETVFRGFLLSTLKRRTGLLPAALLSSALYALVHISNYGLAPLTLTELFVRGMLCAFCVMRAGSLWVAAGMQAAWSFALSQAAPVVSGDLVTDVSAFRFGTTAETYMLVLIAAEAAAIALALFAGVGKLVVRPSGQKKTYYMALEAAKNALKLSRTDDGTPLIRHAQAAARLAEGDEAKAAVLLYHAGADGMAPGFSEDVLEAVRLLESRISSQINGNVIAREAAYAIRMCKGAKAERRNKHARKEQLTETYCPLLRREMEPPDCVAVMQAVDVGTDTTLAMLNTGLCKMCARRNNRRG